MLNANKIISLADSYCKDLGRDAPIQSRQIKALTQAIVEQVNIELEKILELMPPQPDNK